MADEYYTGYQYRLRAGTPMPVARGGFVLHTFMAEKSQVDSYLCTESLPGSEEFRGQGGNLVSANFSRLPITGGNTFQGKIVHNPTFIEEDGMGFN
jgi:hypothetical protein